MTHIQFLFLTMNSIISFSLADGYTTMSDNKIQGRLNIVNGYSTECVMHKFYTDTGWTQIEGEIGRNGIDGLYFKKKNGVIREVLVAESKWNTSNLGWSGKNKLMLQMSQQWVLNALEKLQRYQSLPEYDSIQRLVQHDQYRARLFRMFPVGNDKVQIHIYKIKNKGMNSFNTFLESKLKSITIGEPSNNFERAVLESYDQCRFQALQKYFPMLNEKSISILLKDNYLQKKDILKILTNTSNVNP